MTNPMTNPLIDRPGTLWAGRVMSGLVVTFMLGASVFPKLFLPAVAEEAMDPLGWGPHHILLLAALEVACTVTYAIPRTAPLGAVLLTGLLGGAIAAHVRVGNPLLTHTLFPLWVGILAWGGLWLRDARIRALAPWHAA